ncbi:hypothetical protein GQ457_06G014030 [Hibiscus cannabinus]
MPSDSLSNEQFNNGSNPYYLHQSYSPGMVLVTQPLANDNYNSWKRSMIMLLSAKNKLGFVDGSISAPPSSSVDSFNAWMRANNMVNSCLLNSVSRDIAASLLYHSTAAAIWKDLEDRFTQNNGLRLFQLKKRICDLVQGSLSIGVYYTQLKILWDELISVKPSCTCLQCNCGGLQKIMDDQQRELVMQFLMGLNESFAVVRGQILLMDPMPNITKVFSLVIQEENQRSVALPNHVAEATFAIKAQVNTRRSRPQCSHCGLLGHTKEKCYKLHGYPPGYVSRYKNQCQQLIAMLTSQLQTSSSSSAVPSSSSVNFAMQGKILSFVNSLSSVNIKHSWIIDSGASCHVCYSKELFESLYPIAAGSVLLPNKTVVSVGFAGNVRLSECLLLKNVLFVHEFHFNLLVVSSLIKDSALTVLFSKTHCLIQDLCQVIGKGEYYKGLYLLQLPSAKSDKTRDKFTERALPGVFLGYAPGVKGYKVYVLQSHTIMISRNVIFHEEIFPFHTIAAVDSLVDPFPATVLPHFMQDSSHTTQDSIVQSSVESLPENNHEDVASDMFSEEAQTSPHVSTDIQNPEVEDTDLVHDLVEDNQAHDVQNEVFHETVIPAVRRSTRVSTKPSYLQQYLCNSASVPEISSNGSSNCMYPIENHISSAHLSPEYVEYIFNISLPCEPVFYHQAVKLPEWRDAMQDDLQAMDFLQTWSVVPLPAGKKPIDYKWVVYRIKRKADGSIDRYKARLVAKGFTQIEGVDYVDIFSPVAKLTSFKLLLALAAVHDWRLLQLDVNNAFLNGMLNEEVYMKIPLGYATNVSGDNLVCKLNKSIYGLKQASRQWFCAFSQVVLQFGFTQSPHEHSLFIKGSGDTLVALLVYVDDIILAGKDLKLLAEVQTFLQSHFKLKDLGNLKYFLGFEVARNKSGISLSQRQYAL